jgi:hypothetical protein
MALFTCDCVVTHILEVRMKVKLMVVFFTLFCFSSLFGAAAFAEAVDKDGNAVTWTFYFEDGKNANRAKTKAVEQLKSQGHANVKATVSTTLNKGYYTVLYAAFLNDGVLRKVYAYGFSGTSEEDSQKKAVENFKKVKGWHENRTYTVNKQGTF